MPRERDVSENYFEPPEPADTRTAGSTPLSTSDRAEQKRKNAAGGSANESQSTTLVRLAEEAGATLFHDPDGDAYARLWADDHHEVWPLRRKQFKTWLRRLYYRSTGGAPNAQAMQDALGVLEGQAVFDGERHTVHTRIAEYAGALYHDLANEKWEAVEITANGWRVVSEPPVRFRRSRGMLPIPHPARGGSLEALRPFLNADSDDDYVLFVGWLVQCLRPSGPYLGYEAIGEQGSSKTTRGRIARKLIDPNAAPVRSAPRDEGDLMIAATNSWIVTLDNLSYVPDWLSDGLCRLATGGGLSKRMLYTDADEVVLDAQRPLFVTSIEEVATRGDLLDRLIVCQTPRLPDGKLRPEAELWAEFDQLWPSLYGALLDAVAGALRDLPQVVLERHPRMADAARWATAAEAALGWEPGTFLRAYSENRERGHDIALEASPLASLLQDVAQRGFEGTASELLERLRGLAEDDQRRARWFPKSAAALGGNLTRLAPALRAASVEVVRERESGGKSAGKRSRIISLRVAPQPAVPPDPPVPPPPPETPPEGTATDAPPAPAERDRPPRSSPPTPVPEPSGDDGDEGDGPPRGRSAPASESGGTAAPGPLSADVIRAVRDAQQAGSSPQQIAHSFSIPVATVQQILAPGRRTKKEPPE
jgi:hypothetical protein